MKKLATLTVGLLCFAATGKTWALVCTVPGNTASWAADICMLQTGENDPNAKSVTKCIIDRTRLVRQPCEWNEFYKDTYCKTLIAKGMFHGDHKQCMSDPETIGPTVRDLLQDKHQVRPNNSFKPTPLRGAA